MNDSYIHYIHTIRYVLHIKVCIKIHILFSPKIHNPTTFDHGVNIR